MTADEILENMLERIPDNYDTSTGSFFSDLLKPVAMQLRLLHNKLNTL